MAGKKEERHYSNRIGGLRAAVLGANDGIVSTASLMMGVAASDASHSSIMLAGIAGLVGGALSMAAGEYVSVSSQADTEQSDLERERKELAADGEGELMELAGIYVRRGIEPKLARQVAEQLTAHNALEAHARDELGITETAEARPLQAAVFSAVSFSIGAALPLFAAAFVQGITMLYIVGISSLIALAILGAIAARAGGADMLKGSLRVLFWGAVAMVVTALVGKLFGTTGIG